jgi:hypothetical protein
MSKVEIRITVEIDEAEYAKTYGIREFDAVQDAKGFLGELAAGRLVEHDQVSRVISINGKMVPTVGEEAKQWSKQ